jgi:hypothetical protein
MHQQETAMKLKQWFLKLLGLDKPEPRPLVSHNLSRRVQKHEFILLQVTAPGVFKVHMAGRDQLLNMGDWKVFGRDLQAFCLRESVLWSSLEKGKVHIHCVGMQENLPRGIKYTWRFSKL